MRPMVESHQIHSSPFTIQLNCWRICGPLTGTVWYDTGEARMKSQVFWQQEAWGEFRLQSYEVDGAAQVIGVSLDGTKLTLECDQKQPNLGLVLAYEYE